MGIENDDGRITFYYSRDKRLEKASPAVQKLNNPDPSKKPSLFRTLTSTRPLTYLFISVITISVAIIAVSLFIGSENTRVIGNNALTVTILSSGGKSYVAITKTAKTASAYTGTVNIAVSLPEEDSPIEAERVFFTLEKEEVFRFSVPFTGKKMLVLIEAGAERAMFKVSV